MRKTMMNQGYDRGMTTSTDARDHRLI